MELKTYHQKPTSTFKAIQQTPENISEIAKLIKATGFTVEFEEATAFTSYLRSGGTNYNSVTYHGFNFDHEVHMHDWIIIGPFNNDVSVLDNARFETLYEEVEV